MTSSQLASNLTRVIVQPVVDLLFAAGLLVFMWGLVEFLIGLNATGDSTKKEEGKQHMLWGIVGMFVMVAAWAILKLIDSTVGSNVIQ